MRFLALSLLLIACEPVPSEAPFGELSISANPSVTRVATWNIETVGEPGSESYEHALAILERLRPDVMAINEIASQADEANFDALGADAGFPYVAIANPGFGSDRNGVLSRYPLESASLDGAVLSGDLDANDVTRDFLLVTVELPGAELDLVSMHWKSGSGGGFRRAAEAQRSVQSLGTNPAILLGDLNVDIEDPLGNTEAYFELPSSLPQAYTLGEDLAAQMAEEGLRNAPFEVLGEAGVRPVPAVQLDGSDATRPVSGRRLDYVLTTDEVLWVDHEVFHCEHEDLPGIEKFGDALPASTCEEAADHLPVVLDLQLPIDAQDLEPDDLRISEILANPASCSDSTGEWVEVENTSASPIRLDGLQLEDASGHLDTVRSTALVQPGARAVLVRSGTPCGEVVDGTYGGSVSLNNSGDTLILSNDGGELSVLEYPRTAGQSGRSWSTDGATWCTTEPTPGAVNTACD